MAVPEDLIDISELSHIRCLGCGNILGNKLTTYRLLIQTFAQILMPLRDDSDITLTDIQKQYDDRRQTQLNQVIHIRSNLLAKIGVEYSENNFTTIFDLAQLMEHMQNRMERRQEWMSDALSELRLQYLRNNNMAVTAENALSLDFANDHILEMIIQQHATPKQLANTKFSQLPLSVRLEKVRYPSPTSDIDWYNRFQQTFPNDSITYETLQNVLNEILGLPYYVVLPEIKFTTNDWRLFTSYFNSDSEYAINPIGSVAMDYLGLSRICCRNFLASPIVLPAHAELSISEIMALEQTDSSVLIYSRYTQERPTEKAEREFLAGNITSHEIFTPSYTRAGLSIKKSGISNIVAPLPSLTQDLDTVTTDISFNTNKVTMANSSNLPSLMINEQNSDLPPLTFGGQSLNINENTQQVVPVAIDIATDIPPDIPPDITTELPAPTFEGQSIDILKSRPAPVDIGTIPSLSSGTTRKRHRTQVQPSLPNIPRENIPRGTRGLLAI